MKKEVKENEKRYFKSLGNIGGTYTAYGQYIGGFPAFKECDKRGCIIEGNTFYAMEVPDGWEEHISA